MFTESVDRKTLSFKVPIFKQKQFENFLGIFCLISNIIGCTLVATNAGLVVLGYIFFLFGNIPATYLLLKSNANKTLVMTNLYFMVFNVVGIYRFWGN